MPKKIDPAVKARALRLLKEHRGQYSSLTAACAGVARQERIEAQTPRRWAVQDQIDTGDRPGTTTQEHEQIRKLKAEKRQTAGGRGDPESSNGLLREYFPKGTDLSIHTQQDLDDITDRMNRRPRKRLEYATPYEIFSQSLLQ